MLVVTRFVVPETDGGAFLERALAVVHLLAARPGYLGGRIGRAADDPTQWVLVTEWDGVGAYRRALSAYDVKLAATPLLALAKDEPSAFELLYADGAGEQRLRPSDRAG